MVERDDFEANDRVVMAAHSKQGKSELHSYVQAAMSDLNQGATDHNHAIGY